MHTSPQPIQHTHTWKVLDDQHSLATAQPTQERSASVSFSDLLPAIQVRPRQTMAPGILTATTLAMMLGFTCAAENAAFGESARGISKHSSCTGDILCVSLVQEESAALHKAALQIQPRHDNATEVGDFAKEAAAAFAQSLRPETLRRMQQLKTASASVVKNLPVDWGAEDLLPTDGSGRSRKPGQVSEVVVFGLASIMDTTVQDVGDLEPSYSTGVVHDGFPHKAKGAAIGSSAPQALHSDMSYRPDSQDVPDFLALVCLSPGSRKPVPTRLLANHHVVELLPEDVMQVLRLPLFEIKRPGYVSADGWAARVSETSAVEKPLLLEDSPYPYIATRVYSEQVTPTTPEAAEAYKVLLRTIEAAEDKAGLQIFLDKGDVLLFANKENLHARAVVAKDEAPLFDGKDRFYQRAYFVRGSTCPVG